MPLYHDLDTKSPEGKRTLNNVLKLRQKLKIIPDRNLQKTLLLATWNIREFDSGKYGARLDEAFYYIAEIIDHYDLVAIQEVRNDLSAFKRLCNILGDNWKYIFTDTAAGPKGNSERMAFLYDSRKVHFGGLASELVLPDIKVDVVNPDNRDETIRIEQGTVQFARTPFLVGFTSNYTDFILCTVHILWGSNSADDPRRIEEIKKLARVLKKRTEDETAWARNLILLGDFNIFNKKDATMQAIENQGFIVPEALQQIPGSNVKKNRHYDQIAFRVRDDILEPTNKAGIIDFYEIIFRDEDEATYIDAMGDGYFTKKNGEARTNKEKTNYYKDWRTHQMSDHLPMWVELKIEYTDEYLRRLLED